MRLMALDYGDKTVGIAMTDLSGRISQPFDTILRNNPIDVKETIEKICGIVKEYEVDKVIIGMPYNMDGSEGERAEKTKWFGKKLSKKLDKEIIFYDERLSTFEASNILDLGNIKRENKKKYLDKIAASIILQAYLDNKK